LCEVLLQGFSGNARDLSISHKAYYVNFRFSTTICYLKI